MRRALLVALISALVAAPACAHAQSFTAPPATPRAACGPGSKPAPGLQGRVSAQTPDDGYRCNTELVAREGSTGGFKVEQFTDKAGRRCLYYDTTLIFPFQADQQAQDGSTGVAVIDVTDPAKPTRTTTLVTPAMQSPHESLLVNAKRGLLAAVMGNPAFLPGVVDLYDLNADCRAPQLLASAPVGVLGHESGWSDDGLTFYATSLGTGQVTAVDVSNPRAPRTLTVFNQPSHGFTLSPDGNRGYVTGLRTGLVIVDTSEIQARRPVPQVREVSRLRWPTLSIPQVALPVRFGGRPHLIEVDEFSVNNDLDVLPVSHGPRVGAARIIDIADDRRPKIVSDLRLEVHQPEHRAAIAGDPGAEFLGQGFAGHYCNVPRADDPPIVGCSFIASGLRIFDIRDPAKPHETAYFVAPPATSRFDGSRSNYTMSKPAFDPARRIVWYSDVNSGLYGVRLTNDAWPDERAPAQAPRCASRRDFVIRLPRGLRSATVTVDGTRVRVRAGRRLHARVDLRGKRRTTAVVRVTGRSWSGRPVVQVRRYRTCVRRRGT